MPKRTLTLKYHHFIESGKEPASHLRRQLYQPRLLAINAILKNGWIKIKDQECLTYLVILDSTKIHKNLIIVRINELYDVHQTLEKLTKIF